MKSYEIVQLEDMLGHVYSGRADVAMIDELIAWLQARREAAQQSVQADGADWFCKECGHSNRSKESECYFCQSPRR